MPVYKYRHVGDMEDRSWREPGDPALYRAIRGTWDFARRTIRPRFPPGVYRHRSIAEAKELRAPLEVVRDVAARGWLPVPMFCAGGIATPADAALTMQLGAQGNFVGSGIFKASDPELRAKAIVEATTHFEDPARLLAASADLGEPMRGDDISQLAADGELLQQRGW